MWKWPHWGHAVATETAWMASPLSLTFVIQLLIKGGSSPVGGESEKYYDACVNQTTITLWPHAALWGSFGYLYIGQQQDGAWDALSLYKSSQWSCMLAVDYSIQPPKFKTWFIATKLGGLNNKWSLSSPSGFVSLPSHTIYTWHPLCGCSGELSHMQEEADAKYLGPILALICVRSRCFSGLSLHNKERKSLWWT